MPKFNVREYNWVLVEDTYTVEAANRADALATAAADTERETHEATYTVWESACLQSWEVGVPLSKADPLLVSAGSVPPKGGGRLISTRTGFVGIRSG
jgi:hypothetical protein